MDAGALGSIGLSDKSEAYRRMHHTRTIAAFALDHVTVNQPFDDARISFRLTNAAAVRRNDLAQ